MSATTASPLYVETDESGPGRLQLFPVTFFAVVMGIAGLTLAWQRAAAVFGAPQVIADTGFWLSCAVYAATAVAYALKAVRFASAVRDELAHPVRLSFLPTAAIALLLLATAAESRATALAAAFWWTGMIAQLALTLYVLNAWINRTGFGLAHITPAWFIPIVGNLVVPLDGVSRHQEELSWFFFAVGLVFWAALLPLVCLRLFVAEHPVPTPLLPTLAVLMAPPAVAFVDWTKLQPGPPDAFGRTLCYTALFFLLLIVSQVSRLVKVPFFLSWWAYSFPLAAVTVATIVMTAQLGKPAFMTALSWVELAGLTALVLLLAVRTVLAMARRQICVVE